ncbi:DUF427 domain-containing protein [Roseibium sediminis]|uniref:DUF427 domain-containing protein n=1 Tax=Roseibium sediminis TaxID=1775174 RepID=UPI00123C84FD|nr:DUF427 domain-containing protein [Roseibium sediminis]
MLQTVEAVSNDYQILVEPASGWVEARRGEVLLARTNRAQVMYETRREPVIYFPLEDLMVPLTPDPDFQTFCPFKGTASYFDIEVEGARFGRAVWQYKHPLPESAALAGYIAFMPGVADVIDTGLTELKVSPGHNISGPIVDWMLREAPAIGSAEALTAELGRTLVRNGVAVFRLSVLIWSLHPQIAGRRYVWTRDGDKVEAFEASHEGISTSEAYKTSPFHYVSQGLGGVRQKLDVNPEEFRFSIMGDLREQGATDYVAMPMPFSGGQINILTIASDHPKGFTTANLGLIFECAPILSRLYEVFALKSNAEGLLETYLGARTGARVLGGEIRRGDGDVIDAAILFCDLRSSTRLESELGREAYLELLNHFFEVTTEVVNAHSGEVLKFIGDAVMAIFPVTAGQGEACRQAVQASLEIVRQLAEPKSDAQPPVECGIGVAFGDVTYGNVGSRERLDFTVIGGAANLAARLSDYGKTVGQSIVVAEGVCNDPSLKPIPLGELELRNVSRPIGAFALCAVD